MKLKNFSSINIQNPKTYADVASQRGSRLYPYYAGYAESFAEEALRSMEKNKNSLVFDPWNGSGTTTLAAAKLGFSAIGQDLNPVMVLVAKSGLLPVSEASRLLPLAKKIILRASLNRDAIAPVADEPLAAWFTPSSALSLRSIEAEINSSLVSSGSYVALTGPKALERVSSLAALFYVALFRLTRQLLREFIPSNPTWVKKPANQSARKRPSATTIEAMFLEEVSSMANSLVIGNEVANLNSLPKICMGNSEKQNLKSGSIDIVVTSPPYCTRIDYAVATSIELAVIRTSEFDFNLIRRSLMGTSTVGSDVIPQNPKWGKTCSKFLKQIFHHPSKASHSYYYKNHLQHFNSLSNSLAEISRVLKPNGVAILVVQDSYYKELHNDVAQITSEMGEFVGLSLELRKDFSSARSMRGINSRSKKYLSNGQTTESVLCFTRI